MACPDSEGAPGGVRRRERAEEKGCFGRYYTVRGEATLTPGLGGWHIINGVHTELKRGILASDHMFAGDLLISN